MAITGTFQVVLYRRRTDLLKVHSKGLFKDFRISSPGAVNNQYPSTQPSTSKKQPLQESILQGFILKLRTRSGT